MSILSFIIQYKFIFIFYAVIIAFLALHWKKVVVQAKIIFLYRSKFGLKAMDRFVKKYREWVILLGYVGTGIGFIGMVFISYMLISNLVKLLFVKGTENGVSLVLPGVNVPGLGVLPFWYWLIAIFLIAVIHEFSHGIVARAYNVPVHNTGLVFLGPIIGAFVEPDEVKMAKQSDIAQQSILAAGSFSNILLGLFALLLLTVVFAPWQAAMVEPAGFSFGAYTSDDLPAAMVGLPLSTPINNFNGQEINTFQEFSEGLFCIPPNTTISFIASSGEEYELTTTTNPDNEQKSYVGITAIQNEVTVKDAYLSGVGKIVYNAVDWLAGFMKWLFILSIGIGLFNLLPLPIVDGGKMIQLALHRIKGKEKGEKRYVQISLFFLFVLVFTLIFPLLKNLIM
jgi:membrane-associated protease RseP (regulator of RpoE activity)